MPLNLLVGDVITTKKNHPCGSHDFEIMRTGIDFRIKCLGCDKQIWIERRNLEKRIKKVARGEASFTKDQLEIKNK
ncbi:DUF951 domain-containing protein [Acidaminobacter sp. JC074]|uniref:DUF951 domain-containing protein n=1 Tax=Acidaminobacter sp. JC074 TaxID=2530199 RepID=UPI001F107076|nr:DUF951 domain-containing protein [Acidaminobacter sp. JC074]MCH4887350.1 DUF951 domain-containing protein [Acidaminobacter sp. JC074]